MEWTNEEVTAGGMVAAREQWHLPPHVVRLVMTRAVELAAARGGDGVPSEADLLAQVQGVSLNEGGGVWRREAMRARAHAAAQGATVATLRAKVAELELDLQSERDSHAIARDALHRAMADVTQQKAMVNHQGELLKLSGLSSHGKDQQIRDLRAEVERLNVWTETLKAQIAASGKERKGIERGRDFHNRRAEAAESRLAAIRERAGDGVGIANAVDRDRKQAAEYEVVHTESSAVLAGVRWVLDGDAPQEGRWVPTPVLDDIKYTNGIGVAKWRYPCSPTCTHDDAANPGHPERVKERSEAFLAAAASPADPAETLAHISWSDERRSGYEDGWYKGSEAMRAACWEAVQRKIWQYGLHNLEADFKAAIEGSASQLNAGTGP